MRKSLAIGVLSLCLCLCVGLVSNFQCEKSANAANNPLVSGSFIYVGQGDSILIQAQNIWVLVDGGPSDAGDTVVDYLHSLGVPELQLMVATHMDADHIGGLISVLKSNITIDKVLINNMTDTTSTYSQFITLAESHVLFAAQRGNFYSLTSVVNITVLNPVQPLEFSDQNDNSVVLKLQADKTSFLLEGDATSSAEQSMINAGLNLHSDVLKVGHHGSQYATSDAFLDKVQPTYAVISCGINNQYGFPTPETLQRLSNHNVTTFGTYQSGTITATSDGTTITFLSNYTPITTTSNTTNSTTTVSASPSLPTTSDSAKLPTSTPSLITTPKIAEFPETLVIPSIITAVSILIAAAAKKRRIPVHPQKT